MHNCIELCNHASMTDVLRMPIATAARKGISAVADEAESQRVVLTRLGRPVAVVDSAERLDDDARLVREAGRMVLDAASRVAVSRMRFFSLDEVCGQLGLDPALVRMRAEQLADAA